jgi:pantoate--beta-alanine ligase
VVNKLFNIVQPARAYFGQKDAQQCVVIKKMVKDLNMPLEVIIIPTVREADGLAMSSRNVYLTPEMRRQAPVLRQSMKLAQKLWQQGERDAAKIRQAMTELIQQQPLAAIEYISIANTETLEELQTLEPPVLISMVVKFGNTRLLDNIILE